MGEKLVEEIKAAKGIIDMQDLQNYNVKWRKPVESKIGNLTIISAPPPGSGVILTLIMNVMRGLVPVNDQRIMWQRFVETLKWAYARRTELADPDFVDGIGKSAIRVQIFVTTSASVDPSC